MELPQDPRDGPDQTQDAFDFGQEALGLPPQLARQLQEAAESLTGMATEQRRNLVVAMTAVGAMWVAPVVAARRRRRRRRRRSA